MSMSFPYIPANTQVPSNATSVSGSSGASTNPVFKDQVHSILLAEATPVNATPVAESEHNVDVSQRRRLLELEERKLRLERERFEFEQQQLRQHKPQESQAEFGGSATKQSDQQHNNEHQSNPRHNKSHQVSTDENEEGQHNHGSATNTACWKPSAHLENIFRWTIFGLTCLSWLFVVSSAGTLESAIFLGVLACLIISAALIAVALVIFLLPTIHAVRAWWTARILFCVALFSVFLTFVLDFGSVGAGLSAFNAIILIALIALSFLIMVPEKPLFDVPVFETGVRLSAPSTETPELMDHYEDDKPVVVTPAAPPTKTTRTEAVTPEGHRVVRETVAYPDGRQEVTETVEEPSTIVQKRDQTFVTMKEMTTPDGNRMTVETTKHSDGRQETVEVVEEPSMIGTNVENFSPEVNGDAIQPFDEENPKLPSATAIKEETSTTSRDPSIIGEGPMVSETKVVTEEDSEVPGRRRKMDPPETFDL